MTRVLTLALLIIAVGFISEAKAQAPFAASSQLPEAVQQGVQQEAGKQQIESDELPKAVKQALKKEPLKEWKVSEVYLIEATVEQADPKPMYEVYLTDADRRRAVARFYKNGKAVSGKAKHKITN